MSLRASIDVGSNTLRLLIAEVSGGRVRPVYSARRITRLGSGVATGGVLDEMAVSASLEALGEFSGLISSYGADKVKAVATSALREAADAEMFLVRALRETGIRIEVITGDREAALTLKGVLLSFGKEMPAGMLVVDMGGGSTEWIFKKKGCPPLMGSMPVGVIKLSGKHLRSDPPVHAEIDLLEEEITSVLDDLGTKIGGDLGKDMLFIGTAGTFTTLASLDLGLEGYDRERIHMHRIPLERLLTICRRLISLTLEERKRLKGLEPARADLIIPGVIFTINTMKYFGLHEIVISDYGLLEGVMLDTEETDEKDISKT